MCCNWSESFNPYIQLDSTPDQIYQLSYVEIYKPTYGIIENVCGFLDNGDLGMIKKYGTIKFVLLCLATLVSKSFGA